MHRHFATICSRITQFSPKCPEKISVYQSMQYLYHLALYSHCRCQTEIKLITTRRIYCLSFMPAFLLVLLNSPLPLFRHTLWTAAYGSVYIYKCRDGSMGTWGLLLPGQNCQEDSFAVIIKEHRCTT